jgi:hypothetical protein
MKQIDCRELEDRVSKIIAGRFGRSEESIGHRFCNKPSWKEEVITAKKELKEWLSTLDIELTGIDNAN